MRSVLVFLLVFLLAACTGERIYNNRPDQVVDPVKTDTVVFIDHALSRTKTSSLRRVRVANLSVESQGSEVNNAGSRSVWVQFRNHTDYDYQIEARTQFYSKTRLPIDDLSAWSRLSVSANGTAVYRSTAIDSDAYHYRVEVREAR